jgi:hypothetical protein
MSTDRIEKLYKNFGILADSKDKSEVSLHFSLVASYLYHAETSASIFKALLLEKCCIQRSH